MLSAQCEVWSWAAWTPPSPARGRWAPSVTTVTPSVGARCSSWWTSCPRLRPSQTLTTTFIKWTWRFRELLGSSTGLLTEWMRGSKRWFLNILYYYIHIVYYFICHGWCVFISADRADRYWRAEFSHRHKQTATDSSLQGKTFNQTNFSW